jgi:Co/Zn/Cd efflux system component
MAFLWTVWQKYNTPIVPDASILSMSGFGALIVNLGCAFLLVHYRSYKGSLTRAAFLSARNDAFANLAIILTAIITFYWSSVWPDLVVGLGIAAMNLDAAKEVFLASKKEYRDAKP